MLFAISILKKACLDTLLGENNWMSEGKEEYTLFKW